MMVKIYSNGSLDLAFLIGQKQKLNVLRIFKKKKKIDFFLLSLFLSLLHIIKITILFE